MTNHLKPGVNILEVRHDADCPAAHGDPDHCVCESKYEIHQDVERAIRKDMQNRAQRREAERAARRALRKAIKKKAG